MCIYFLLLMLIYENREQWDLLEDKCQFEGNNWSVSKRCLCSLPINKADKTNCKLGFRKQLTIQFSRIYACCLLCLEPGACMIRAGWLQLSNTNDKASKSLLVSFIIYFLSETLVYFIISSSFLVNYQLLCESIASKATSICFLDHC
jgi:hypothetical protein